MNNYHQFYEKRLVALDRITNSYKQNEDGTPILAEKIKTCRLTEREASLLNGLDGDNWKSSGIIFVLVEPKKVKKHAPAKDNEEPEQDNEYSEEEVVKLREEAKELGIKSYQIMKPNTLEKKITEFKNK